MILYAELHRPDSEENVSRIILSYNIEKECEQFCVSIDDYMIRTLENKLSGWSALSTFNTADGSGTEACCSCKIILNDATAFTDFF